jgi:hypothetical protein
MPGSDSRKVDPSTVIFNQTFVVDDQPVVESAKPVRAPFPETESNVRSVFGDTVTLCAETKLLPAGMSLRLYQSG